MTTVAEKIVAHLERHTRTDKPLETAGEIGVAIGAVTATVMTNLRRLEGEGVVRKVGEAQSGARTWALASDTRFPAA